jgi:formylglycine-generating enzyme required for sulfatase activity
MSRVVPLLLVLALSLTATAQEKKIINSVGMKFVLILDGTFTMGSPETEVGRGSDESQHEVTITRPFYLGVYEVTQGQYERVMGKNPSFFAPTGGGKQRLGKKATDDHPVENVSWNDAVAFCKKLGERSDEQAAGHTYRLPTEAEWEYACRAGTTTPFHYGSDLDSYKANFNGLIYAAYGKAGAGPFFRCTVKVGDYQPNAWGLYDTHGNVQEWCADWYAADYYYAKSPKADPPGPATGAERVLRGGGWPNSGKAVRSAVRNKLPPDEKHYSAGFRVVLVTK